MRWTLIITLLLCTSLSFAENALEFEPVDALSEITKNFILKNIVLEPDETIEVQVNAADLPSRLVKCNNKIEASFPKETNREKINAIALACPDTKPWQVYIPVNVQIFTKVVIAKYPIPSDTNISEADLDYSQVNISNLYNGYFKNKNEVEGYVTAQTINAGTVITKKNVKRPQLVHKNQEIDLIARKNAIEVSMKVIAKSDGGLNDAITAYNPSSKKTIEAKVTGLNRAEVIS